MNYYINSTSLLINETGASNDSLDMNDEELDLDSLSMEEILSKNVCICMGEIAPKDYPRSYAIYNLVIVIILIPLLAFFGVISNLINIYVFTRNSMITPTNVYLASLARSDFLVIITGVFIFCLDSIRDYFPDITDFATQSIVWVMPMGYIAQTCSVYCTVGAAMNCFVKLCLPSVSRRWCTVGFSRITVLLIVIFSLGYNSLRFWQFFLHPCYYHDTLTVELCVTQFYKKIYVPYTVYMYTLLMAFIPFLLLTVLNGLILRTIRKQKQKRKNCCTNENYLNSHQSPVTPDITPNDNSDENEDPDVMTLVMVVILFLSCNFLALVINIVEAFFEPEPVMINFLNDMSNFLVILNSSVNFIIYVIFDADYKRVVIDGCISNGNKYFASKKHSDIICNGNLRRSVTAPNEINVDRYQQNLRCDLERLVPNGSTGYYNVANSLSVQTYIRFPKNSIDFVTSICFNGHPQSIYLETEV